jgi:hypothetical protein
MFDASDRHLPMKFYDVGMAMLSKWLGRSGSAKSTLPVLLPKLGVSRLSDGNPDRSPNVRFNQCSLYRKRIRNYRVS